MDFMDFFEYVAITIIVVVVFGVILLAIVCIKQEIRWYNTPPFEHECRLLNTNFLPSTKTSHVTPIFNQKHGTSFAVTQTGHDDIHVTIWDCGIYGRIISKEKEIFQYAKDPSILLLKALDGEVRIYDIKH